MTRPSAAIRRAWGVDGDPVLLDGGQGVTWRVGGLVLKPGWEPETTWRAAVLSRLTTTDHFAVPEPMPTLDGAWWQDGYEAWRFADGAPDPSRVDDIVLAGLAFGDALRAVPRPSFLDDRDDPWAVADRIAFGEAPPPELPVVLRLLDVAGPVTTPSSLIHGDLLGNVMFAPGRRPLVMDWPPYWRPRAHASAVAVIDAMCWHGADPSVLDRWSHLPEWNGMCARALVFRIATDRLAAATGAEVHPAYARAIDAVLDRAARGAALFGALTTHARVRESRPAPGVASRDRSAEQRPGPGVGVPLSIGRGPRVRGSRDVTPRFGRHRCSRAARRRFVLPERFPHRPSCVPRRNEATTRSRAVVAASIRRVGHEPPIRGVESVSPARPLARSPARPLARSPAGRPGSGRARVPVGLHRGHQLARSSSPPAGHNRGYAAPFHSHRPRRHPAARRPLRLSSHRRRDSRLP
ncbi:hypothetical protein [Stackebrandtia soli]|uniref:hypothetical protein n=1 Tax=Stackebrandtia soli TaxID=1892856 RepID=UPI0039ECD1F8